MAAVETGAGTLEFRVLGPLEVVRSGRPVRLGGGRQRGLLALLVLNANEVVSAERLINDLYGGDPSGTAGNALQAIVSRLRRTLDDDPGESVVATRAPGYVLRVAAEQVDLAVFERLAEEGRGALARGDPARAAVVLREALALWRGSPLADVLALDAVQPEVRRLEELRLAALMDRIDANLAAGPGHELVPELEALVAINPLQERLRGQLMLALYRAGRQADALAVYRETRAFLRDELGLEPSRALQQLERAILGHEAALGPVLGSADRDAVVVCPYKGLAAFEVGDAEFFSGRERVVADVISRLTSSSLVGIVGASGVGKSSILRAGVLKRLSLGVLPGSERWRIVVIRPGARPAEQLEPLLGGGLDELRTDQRLVVVVDQLEEAFTLCPDEAERAAFFGTLAELVCDAARRAFVIVTLRADFYGRCSRYHPFAQLLSRSHVLVGPMERHELVRVIELPAARAGLQVERPLVDSLVADVIDEPGGLPLLSTALLELWSRRDGRVLRFDSYRATGGVRGAVARMAEAAYAELSGDEQAVARVIFLRLTLGEGDALARRRVPLEQLEPEVAEVVERLAAARLLTVRNDTVEVAHDALLREWPRLVQWLDEDRDGRRVHAHLAAAAREWHERGRDRGDLYRRARLSAALEWSEVNEREASPLEREFLVAARRANERAAQRLRVGIAVLAALLLAALAAGALALVSRSQAKREATAATVRELSNAADLNLTVDPERSILLALQAVESGKKTGGEALAEATNALHRAVDSSRVRLRLLGHRGDVVGVAVSPSRGLIATLGVDGTLRVWTGKTGARVRTITTDAPAPRTPATLSFSPDGSRVAAPDGNTAGVWDVASGKQIMRLPGGANGVEVARFRPDGKEIATAAAGGPALPGSSGVAKLVVRTWDASSGHLLQTITVPPPVPGPCSSGLPYATLAYTAKGRRLFGAIGSGILYEWNSATGRVERSIETGPCPIESIATSPDGKLVAIGSADTTVSVRDTATGNLVYHDFSARSVVNGIDIDSTGRFLATSSADGMARVLDLQTGKLLLTLAGHAGAVENLRFLPGGSTLVTTGADGTVRLWDISPSGSAEWAVMPMANRVWAVAASPNGRLVATADVAGDTALWTIHGQKLWQKPNPSPIADLAFARNGTLLAESDFAGDVIWRNARTGATERMLKLSPHGAFGMAISPDGQRIALARTDGASVYGTRSGKLLFTVGGFKGEVDGVDFSSDGKLLAISGGRAIVVDAHTGALRITLQQPTNGIAIRIKFSPNGRLIAAGNADGSASIWDAKTGHLLHVLTGHSGAIFRVAFNQDSSLLATGSLDGTAKIWQISNPAAAPVTLQGHTAAVYDVAFTPDGKRLVNSSRDDTTRIDAINLNDLTTIAHKRLTRTLTIPECQQYLHRPNCPPPAGR